MRPVAKESGHAYELAGAQNRGGCLPAIRVEQKAAYLAAAKQVPGINRGRGAEQEAIALECPRLGTSNAHQLIREFWSSVNHAEFACLTS
jgi:hypothetical protein